MNLFSRTGLNGLSDSINAGGAGTVYKQVGIDSRTEPGVIKAHQKLRKDDPGFIEDSIIWVAIIIDNITDGDTVESVLYGGEEMTQAQKITDGNSTRYLYFKVNPKLGVQDVTVNGEVDDKIRIFVTGYGKANTIPTIFGQSTNTGIDIELELTPGSTNSYMIALLGAERSYTDGLIAHADTNFIIGDDNAKLADFGPISTDHTLGADFDTSIDSYAIGAIFEGENIEKYRSDMISLNFPQAKIYHEQLYPTFTNTVNHYSIKLDDEYYIFFWKDFSVNTLVAQLFKYENREFTPVGNTFSGITPYAGYGSGVSLGDGERFIFLWNNGDDLVARVFRVNKTNGNFTALGSGVLVVDGTGFAYSFSLVSANNNRYIAGWVESNDSINFIGLEINTFTYAISLITNKATYSGYPSVTLVFQNGFNLGNDTFAFSGIIESTKGIIWGVKADFDNDYLAIATSKNSNNFDNVGYDTLGSTLITDKILSVWYDYVTETSKVQFSELIEGDYSVNPRIAEHEYETSNGYLNTVFSLENDTGTNKAVVMHIAQDLVGVTNINANVLYTNSDSDTISAGVEFSLGNASGMNYAGWDIAGCAIDTSHFISVWVGAASDLFARTFSISGTTISNWGAESEIQPSGNQSEPKIIKLAGETHKFVVIYRNDSTNTIQGIVLEVNASTGNIGIVGSINTNILSVSSVFKGLNITHLTGNLYALVNANNNYQVSILNINPATGVISVVSTTTHVNYGNNASHSILKLRTEIESGEDVHYLIWAYPGAGGNDGVYCSSLSINTTTNAVTFYDEVQIGITTTNNWGKDILVKTSDHSFTTTYGNYILSYLLDENNEFEALNNEQMETFGLNQYSMASFKSAVGAEKAILVGSNTSTNDGHAFLFDWVSYIINNIGLAHDINTPSYYFPEITQFDTENRALVMGQNGFGDNIFAFKIIEWDNNYTLSSFEEIFEFNGRATFNKTKSKPYFLEKEDDTYYFGNISSHYVSSEPTVTNLATKIYEFVMKKNTFELPFYFQDNIFELCKVALTLSDGSNVWFSAERGVVWREVNGEYTVMYLANEPILGAEQHTVTTFEDGEEVDNTQYVYFATATTLYRVALSDIATYWEPEEVGTFRNGDTNTHKMISGGSGNYIYIADGRDIASVSPSGVFEQEQFLRLPYGERITDMCRYDIDILIGTELIGGYSARVLRWDGSSETWSAEDAVQERAVNAFITDDNYVYVSAGDYGNIYMYTGAKMEIDRKIPGTYDRTHTGVVNASSVGYLAGIPIFGYSNMQNNPTMQGIYGYGRFSNKYNMSLSLDFPLSNGEFDDLTIGAILVRGYDFWVSWKRGDQTGIDKIDWTQKYPGYIETAYIFNDQLRNVKKTVARVYANYIEMPDNTSIGFSYKKKNEIDFNPLSSVNDKLLQQLNTQLSIPEIANLQLKFKFNVDGNNSPRIEDFAFDATSNGKTI